jgi:hypothetical protein
MAHFVIWPKHRAAALRDLALALGETTPPFGKRIAPDSVTEATRLEFIWQFEACEKRVAEWRYNHNPFRWHCRMTIKNFLDQFSDLPAAPN